MTSSTEVPENEMSPVGDSPADLSTDTSGQDMLAAGPPPATLPAWPTAVSNPTGPFIPDKFFAWLNSNQKAQDIVFSYLYTLTQQVLAQGPGGNDATQLAAITAKLETLGTSLDADQRANTARFDIIQNEITEVGRQLDLLTTSVNALPGSDDARLTAIEASIHTLSDALATIPSDIDSRLQKIQEEVEALTASVDPFITALSAPVELTILIDGRSSTSMPTNISDQSCFAVVVPHDAIGRHTTDPNPFTWTVTDVDGLTIDAAVTAEDPNHVGDTAYSLVTVTAPDASGNQVNFYLHVTDGTLTASSDELVPTAGVPSSLVIELSPD